MTPLRHARSSIYELRPNDEIFIGRAKYTVEKTAKGGMGLVLILMQSPDSPPSAFSVHGIKVALKTLLPEFRDESTRKLFQRELTVWAGFRNPNVLGLNEIIDAGADGWVAAMDWCPGSLRDYLKRRGRLDLKESTDILEHIFDGLKYAYDKDQVIHLDLKPENVLYHINLGAKKQTRESDKWRFMVSDWGIASVKEVRLQKIVGSPPSNADCTQTFNNMGTVLYMAPERFIRGQRSTIGSDMFSLGMIYHEMLTGHLPFSYKEHPVEDLLSRRYLNYAQTRLQQASVSKHVQKVALNCLAYDPADRPDSYLALRGQIAHAWRKTTSIFGKIFA